MTEQITVQRVRADTFRVSARGHTLVVDQPTGGGAEAGPTPTELFVMGLASCVAFYAVRALGRGSEEAPLSVTCRWTMSSEPPWRVQEIDLVVHPPMGLEPARVAAIERAVQHCTVHNSLVHPPEVTLHVQPVTVVAA